MIEAALQSVLRRDRIVVAAALVMVIALAWVYVLWLAADMEMGGMDMTGFRMIPAGMGLMAPAVAPWQPIEFAFMFAMWAVMMIGMMTPSSMPMILLYARVGRQAASAGKPLAATGWFVGGYLLIWTAFALVATSAQWALERTSLLTPTMVGATDMLGGIVMIAAGLYQWTPLKDVCLRQCQTPWLFIQQHGGFRGGAAGSTRHPLRSVLRRLLLGADGIVVRRRGNECAVDRGDLVSCAGREGRTGRPSDFAHCRRGIFGMGRVAV
jgi:predicted metal-binding membrane protein